MTPTEQSTKTTDEKNVLKVQSSFFDLDDFASVPVYKEQVAVPVNSLEEALSKVGNDNAALLKVINRGLEAEIKKEMRTSMDGWLQTEDDAPYTGKPADEKKVGVFILTLAKTIFGYNKGMTKEAKKAAKESATKMALENEVMRNGIATNCAFTPESVED